MIPDVFPDPRSALEWYASDALKTMARIRSERGRDARSKAEALRLLQECLFEPASVRQAIATAEPLVRDGLALLKRHGGAMAASALRGQLAAWHPELPGEATRAVPSELVRRALAFWHAPSARYHGTSVHDIRRPATDNEHGALIYSAPEILDHVVVPENLGAFELLPLEPSDPMASETSWQRQVMAFLRAIETRAPKVLQSGQLGVRDREALAVALGLAPEVKDRAGRRDANPHATRYLPIAFLRSVLGAAGLVEVAGDRVLRTTPKALQFVSQPPSRQVTTLLEAWIEGGENELFWQPHLRLDRRASSPTIVPDEARTRAAHRFLIERLRERARPGYWYDLVEFSRAARWTDVEFLVSWRDPVPYRWSSYYYDRERFAAPVYAGITLEDSRGRSSELTLGQDWELVEGAFIRAVFEGPLTWLGLVECQARPNGPVVFALTPLGARALGIEGGAPVRAEPPPAPPADALVVQPNFEVVIYDPEERLELLFQVDRFAERVSVDRLALYRLSRDSVCAGLQLGLKVEDVLALLDGAARAPLPQNVVVSLRDWARQFEAVRWVRNAWLLEAPDAASLDDWLALPDLGPALDRRISPTAALMSGACPADLPAILARAGVEVRLVDAGEPLTPSVFADDDGGLRIPDVDADFFLLTALAELADPLPWECDEARFRVTAGSIARAKRSGKSVEGILEVLEKTSRRTLPGGLVVRVKGWGGAYGPVELGPVGLFVAPDAASFRELRADPALAEAFIQDVSPTSAIVRLDLLERLDDALRERGIATFAYEPPRPRRTNPAKSTPSTARPVLARQSAAQTRQTLARAIADHEQVILEYRRDGAPDVSSYLVEPLEIRDRAGAPVLHGYCPTRDGFRDFKLANIVAIGFTPRPTPT